MQPTRSLFVRRLVTGLIAVVAAVGPAVAQDGPARVKELDRALLDARVRLAEAALDKDLLREATMLAGSVLVSSPEHPLRERIEAIKAMSAADFVRRYQQALKKHGRSFRKDLQNALGPIVGEFCSLAEAAQKADDVALAESLYSRATEIDPDDDRSRRALKKLDYDVIFNYGVLPKSEKQAAREVLRRLRGKFLQRQALRDELEFWVDAWGLQTRHYRFVTNADHRTVFAFAQACEDLHAEWERWMSEHKQPVRRFNKPLSIYLLGSKIDYETVLRLSGDDPLDSDDVLGFYSPSTKVGCFYCDEERYGEDRTLLFETFYHEGAHQLFDLRFKSPWRGPADDNPLHWVEEGVCCYLETLVMTGEGAARKGAFGGLVDDDLGIGVKTAGEGELLPSADFIHQAEDEWDAYDLGYQHAALMVHWLMHAEDGRFHKVLFELLLAERQNAGLRKQSLFDRLGLQPEQLDKELKAYAAKLGKTLPWRQYVEDR